MNKLFVFILPVLFTLLFCGCSQRFVEGSVKTGLAATDAYLDAEIEYQKRKLAAQAERNRKLAQRNAVIESRLSDLGPPQNVSTTTIAGHNTILYTYDSKITINRVIHVLGTPDKVKKEDGITVYGWGDYVANDFFGFVIIAKLIRK